MTTSLAKSLDVVRPGGVIALITSRYTMDKQDSAVRRHLADGSILVGRNPAAQYHIQGECRNGCDHRYSVPPEAVARTPPPARLGLICDPLRRRMAQWRLTNTLLATRR